MRLLAAGIPLLVLVIAAIPAVTDDGASQLTVGGAYDPDWSPDGSQIVFAGAGSGYGYDRDLYVIPSTGGTATRIEYPDCEVISESSPSWSPNGSQIAFAAYQFRSAEVSIIPSGGGTRIVIGNPYPATQPDWSPDGSQIVYQCYTNFEPYFGIYVYTLATGQARGLIHLDMSYVGYPSWSPDGSWIAYCANVIGNRDIWLVPAPGGTRTQITFDPGRDCNPCWSPDGSQIAFTSDRSGGSQIWVIPGWGGTPTQITTDGGEDPAWSPDGSQIAFISRRGGSPDIWVIDAEPPVAISQDSWGSIKGMYR
jgi:Tol biopolymer transport system component